MRITRSDFVRSLEGQKVSLEKLNNDAGISSSAKDRLARADRNRDGYVSGAGEADQLFTQMDHYDRDGNIDSVNTNNSDVMSVHQALMRSVEAPASNSNTDAPSRSRLGDLLASNPGLRDNQDLLNFFLRRNHSNWNAAATEANRYGVDINDLVANREAPIRDNGVTTTPAQPTTPTRPTTDNNTPVDGIGQVAGMENTTPAFRRKVVEVAERLQMDPTHLMAVMSFETGETFSPSERNRWTGATGLIQFMPSTARSLGTSTSELARMTPERQLDYVETYLEPYRGKMDSLEDAYMAVLWPAAVGKGPNHVLFRRGTREYRQNDGLDLNNNGYITAREAASKVRAKIR